MIETRRPLKNQSLKHEEIQGFHRKRERSNSMLFSVRFKRTVPKISLGERQLFEFPMNEEHGKRKSFDVVVFQSDRWCEIA
jgi:hypothetical protein